MFEMYAKLDTRIIIYSILAVGIFGSIIIKFILNKIGTRQTFAEVNKTIQESEKLSSPCTVQIFLDGRYYPDEVWQYALSLNNSEKKFASVGDTIEFTTTQKTNALIGFGRGGYEGYKVPAFDLVFKFEAIEGGIVKLVSRPEWDYADGDSLWRSNISMVEPT